MREKPLQQQALEHTSRQLCSGLQGTRSVLWTRTWHGAATMCTKGVCTDNVMLALLGKGMWPKEEDRQKNTI